MTRAVFSAWRRPVQITFRAFCLFVGVLSTLVLGGCDAQRTLKDLAREAARQRGIDTGPDLADDSPATAVAEGESIRIASFNIEVFGISKLSKSHVMQVLAQVARRFDVLAIQEIRSVDQTVLPRFVELINSQGARYNYQIGPRLGRTSSKEQYAFIYDSTRIEIKPGSVYTVSDPEDYLHREPLVAGFRVRGPRPDEAFSFKLINIHTDPDEADLEVDALARVFLEVQRDGSGEDDCILLGDLNVDEYHLGHLGQIPGIVCAISGKKTNTRQTKAYDNILFDRRATTEYVGRSGVLDLMAEFNLSKDQALDVSDHLPVWAEFHVREGQPDAMIAVRPGETAR
jgi:endonuclease/exonuclease/phosphatase family metal-dependent hydrolase